MKQAKTNEEIMFEMQSRERAENAIFETQAEASEFEAMFQKAVTDSNRDFYMALLGMCLAAGVALLLLATDDAHAEPLALGEEFNLEEDFIDPDTLWCGDYGFDFREPNLVNDLCDQIGAQDRLQDMVNDQMFALEEKIEKLEAEKEIGIRRLSSARRTIRRLKRTK
jgi:hypothetical protein